CLDSTREAGRLTNPRSDMESKGKEMADMLIQRGWIERCHWLDESRCLVPSASKDLQYLVVLPEYTCDCVAASSGGLCKHLHIALEAAHQRGHDMRNLQDNIAEAVMMHGNVSVTNTTVFVQSTLSNSQCHRFCDYD
ncbi:hypothetical protein E3U43_017866, partial [Larimichthys crocea]